METKTTVWIFQAANWRRSRQGHEREILREKQNLF